MAADTTAEESWKLFKKAVMGASETIIMWSIKLLEHRMNMFEKILEHRHRTLNPVNNMQFGFSSAKGTTDAVFIYNICKKNT